MLPGSILRYTEMYKVHLVANVAPGAVLVHVVEIGLRKQGSQDDPYELAIESLRRGDTDAQEALELFVQELQKQGPSPGTGVKTALA